MQPEGHLESLLLDQFGRLNLEDKTNDHPQDIDDHLQRLTKETKKRYRRCLAHPIKSFQQLLYYRVVHSKSPAKPDGSPRSRLDPSPASLSEELAKPNNEDLKKHVENHCDYTHEHTPFISVTCDFLRAIHYAFYIHKNEDKVAILIIRPWMLKPDSDISCNDIRLRIGLPYDQRKDREYLIWGEVPAESILCRWSRPQILKSNLLGNLPFELKSDSEPSLKKLRDLVKGLDISLVDIAKALIWLGMDPCQIEIKQVALYLFARIKDIWLELRYEKIDDELIGLYSPIIHEFDRAVHEFAKSVGKQRILSYYKNQYLADANMRPLTNSHGGMVDKRSRREWGKLNALVMEYQHCPSFKTWWVLREEGAFEGPVTKQKTQHERSGLREFMAKMVL